MKKIFLCLLFLIFIFQADLAFAGDAALPEKVKKLIKIYNLDEYFDTLAKEYLIQMQNYMRTSSEEFKKEYPWFDEDYLRKIEKEYEDGIKEIVVIISSEKMKLAWINLYMSSFSDSEIDELLKFYELPIGEKVIEARKEIEPKFRKFFNDEINKKIEEANNKFNKSLKDIYDEYDKEKHMRMLSDLDKDESNIVQEKVEALEKEYGVVIDTGYGIKKKHSILVELDFEGEKLSGEELIIMLSVLRDFLSRYPKSLTSTLIRDIYLSKNFKPAGKINEQIAGFAVKGMFGIHLKGGRYYLPSLMTMHHEFAHVLIGTFENPFADVDSNSELIKKMKEKYFVDDDSIQELNEELFPNGFLTSNSLRNVAEDFCSFAGYYWVKPNKLKEIASKNEKIANKLKVTEDFYNKIFNKFPK